MPRPLTAVAVSNLKPDPARRLEIADGATPGLRLIVQPSGAKSWAFRYERSGRRPVKLTLGPAAGPGALSLSDARQRASEARRGMADGVDPAEARKAERAAADARAKEAKAAAEAAKRREDDTVNACLDRYVKRHVDGLKSAHEVRRLFDKEIRPNWGARPVHEITRSDVVRLIDGIVERGAGTTANRTLANMRAWLNWCVDRGILEGSPAGKVRMLQAETSRERVLADAEIRDLATALPRLEWPWRQFYTVALLTGQRREEVAGMRWDELDLESDDPVWILPPGRTKNGREHAVPLVPAIVETIRSAPRMAGCAFVFSTTGKTSVSGFSRAKAALDAAMTAVRSEAADAVGIDRRPSNAPWRLHDLRRTAASGMARNGVPVAVVEKVLNHVSGTFGGIVGVYQRHDFAAEKRHALNVWATHVEGLGRPFPSQR